jgi:hypothetical protein
MPRMTLDQALSPHFHLSEFTASQTATRQGMRNEPGMGPLANLQRLALVLEDVRAALGGNSIVITSGYRSTALNAQVGGAKDSAHAQGCAADFICPRFGSPRLICQRIIDVGLCFDQLIDERTWVHLGIAMPNADPRRQVLTAFFQPGAPTRYAMGLLP